MKKLISIIFIVCAVFATAQQTATDTTLKTVSLSRINQETDILDNNRCYQILLREQNVRLLHKPRINEKNTPAVRLLKALQMQFYLENCTENDKNNFKSFQKIRY